MRLKTQAPSKKPVRPVTVRWVPTGVFMSCWNSCMRSWLNEPHQTYTRWFGAVPSMRIVGSMLWMLLAAGTRWEMIGPPAWSVHGPVGLSETATPMANLSAAGLSRSLIGTYQ